MLALLLLVGGGATIGLVLAAWGFAGTSLGVDDFASGAEARDFLDSHLPVGLPEDAVIRALTFDRFTDWHLEATVDLGSAHAAAAYLGRAEEVRARDPEYCGPGSSSASVDYFIAKWHACGAIVRANAKGLLRVTCYTR